MTHLKLGNWKIPLNRKVTLKNDCFVTEPSAFFSNAKTNFFLKKGKGFKSLYAASKNVLPILGQEEAFQ